MYQYEQILNEHRQRVARGAQNYERRRVAEERAAETTVAESDSSERSDGDNSPERLRIGIRDRVRGDVVPALTVRAPSDVSSDRPRRQ